MKQQFAPLLVPREWLLHSQVPNLSCAPQKHKGKRYPVDGNKSLCLCPPASCMGERTPWLMAKNLHFGHNLLPVTQASLQPSLVINCKILSQHTNTQSDFMSYPECSTFHVQLHYQPFDFYKELLCTQVLLNSRHHKTPCMHYHTDAS